MTTKITKEEFVLLYNNMSLSALAKKIKVCRKTAFDMARRFDLPLKKSGGTKGKKYKHININNQELERLYNSMTTKKLAKRLKLSVPTLISRVKELGINIKKSGRKNYV